MAVASPKWKFFLAASSTLGAYGELSQARNKTLEMTLNRPGAASFSIPIEYEVGKKNEIVSQIEPLSTSIVCVRDGVVVWSGPVWTIEEDGSSGMASVKAVGWFEILNHRFVDTTADLIYTSVDAGTIAYNLLGNANGVAATSIIQGTAATSESRTRTYKRGANIGAEIIALSDIEAGFDLSIDPSTRALNIHNPLQTDQRDTVHFAYRTLENNVQGFSRALDASQLANRVTVVGQYGSARQTDPGSQGLYGTIEDWISLSDVVDNNILLVYAATEVALRSTPRATYTVVPKVTGPERVPAPFTDYSVGDLVLLSAKHGRMALSGVSTRVFSMTISIDNNGNERVTSLGLAS